MMAIKSIQFMKSEIVFGGAVRKQSPPRRASGARVTRGCVQCQWASARTREFARRTFPEPCLRIVRQQTSHKVNGETDYADGLEYKPVGGESLPLAPCSIYKVQLDRASAGSHKTGETEARGARFTKYPRARCESKGASR